MGWWGFSSDQNDNTYNEIGIGVPDRITGAEIPPEADQRLTELHERLRMGPDRDPVYIMAAFVGICRLLLSHGVRIAPLHLESAIEYARTLVEDKDHAQCFTEPDTRLKALQDEIAGFEDAIVHNGTTDFFGESETLMGIIESSIGEDNNQA